MNCRAILLALVLALVLAASPAGAQTFRSTAPPPRAALAQRLDAALPLGLPLTRADGQPVRLDDYFHDGRPVLLVLGYYRCPQLCGLLMQGLIDALSQGGLPASSYRIVGVSIDAQDTPATAAARRRVYLDYAAFARDGHEPQALPELHLLVGSASATARLAEQAGFSYAPDAPEKSDVGDPAGAAPTRFAHPAGVIVATPEGRISRYLMGVQFDPRELRLALVDASQARIGTLSDRIALLCAHVDLSLGRHSTAVMNTTRATGGVLLLLFGGWLWRRRHVRDAGRDAGSAP